MVAFFSTRFILRADNPTKTEGKKWWICYNSLFDMSKSSNFTPWFSSMCLLWLHLLQLSLRFDYLIQAIRSYLLLFKTTRDIPKWEELYWLFPLTRKSTCLDPSLLFMMSVYKSCTSVRPMLISSYSSVMLCNVNDSHYLIFFSLMQFIISNLYLII